MRNPYHDLNDPLYLPGFPIVQFSDSYTLRHLSRVWAPYRVRQTLGVWFCRWSHIYMLQYMGTSHLTLGRICINRYRRYQCFLGDTWGPVTKRRSFPISSSSLCPTPEDFMKLFTCLCLAHYFQWQSDFFRTHCDTILLIWLLDTARRDSESNMIPNNFSIGKYWKNLFKEKKTLPKFNIKQKAFA